MPAVAFLVTKSSPQPGPSHIHKISPSSLYSSTYIIVTSMPMTFPTRASALTISNMLMNNKPYVSTKPDFSVYIMRLSMSLAVRGSGLTFCGPLHLALEILSVRIPY